MVCAKYSIFFLTILLLESASTETRFNYTHLGSDYFETVYAITIANQPFFLTASCKDRDILSLSLTKEREFRQAPVFNIYGDEYPKPKMGRGSYTFMRECKAQVSIKDDIIEIKRLGANEVVFALTAFSFEQGHNKFIVLDKSTKWGLGQRFQKDFSVKDGKWVIWNRDKPWVIDDGKGQSHQTYGHHPVYLARETLGKQFHLSYFKNTNGLLIQSLNNSSQMEYHSIGGQIQFYLIFGKDPEEILEKYHDYIGAGHIPPFWSFGHHQCRWGYKTFSDIKTVVQKYNNNDIPLDTMWSDLDYMKEKFIFTVDQSTFPSKQMNQFFQIEQLHFVPLLDVGIGIDDKEAIDSGKELNIFLKHPKNKDQFYLGEVWPGFVHYVDFLNPNSTNFWKGQLSRLYKSLHFSGIWLDMNEPSNFKGGQFLQSETFKIQAPENLNSMTISGDLIHYDRHNPNGLEHKEVHAYYGHLSTVPTFEFLLQKGRPFIISRSSSVGSGHFAGHWTGDNVANWDFLRLSISGNFLFQIFGIQMVGADICGFYKDTTEQLCARWHQIGAFYPFARNHNHETARGQEPYAFGANLLETARISIKTRYALLKQLYTIFLLKKGKGSYYRPLFLEFQNQQSAYEKEISETQVLIGSYLMSTPIVYPGRVERNVYFPGEEEVWYRFELNPQSGGVNEQTVRSYQSHTKETITNPLPSAPPTFLRGGFLIFTNVPENRSVKLNNQFHIFAALRKDEAKGNILGIGDYNKESDIKQCIDDKCLYQLTLQKTGQQSFILSWNYLGRADIMTPLTIKSLLVVDYVRRWKNVQTIVIKTAKGERQILAPLLK